MTVQAKFPAVLPTPAEARRRLGEASRVTQALLDEVVGFKDHADAAKEEIEAAEKELVEIERVMVDAAEGSQEEASAEGEWDKAWRRVTDAEKGLANVKRTLKAAKAEYEKSRARLVGVRQDIAAIRVGRRKS